MTSTARLDGNQLIATRYVDAEPALVQEAFTTPQHLAAFWGGATPLSRQTRWSAVKAADWLWSVG